MALLEFYGDLCPHCLLMAPLVDDLKNEGFTVEQLEVWSDDKNAKRLTEMDQGMCGGVPFFFNTETKKFICGSTDYETLKAWADGTMA